MPPHLHPRSRMTSSLFATTVIASFLVVGLPHILPCPAPRVAYADASNSSSPDGTATGRRRATRRRSPQQTTEVKDGIAQFESTSTSTSANTGNGTGKEERVSEETAAAGQRIPSATTIITGTPPRGKRECPVPKPPGVLGELMGFKKEKERGDDTSVSTSTCSSSSGRSGAAETIAVESETVGTSSGSR